ncbi:MAG: hypothetical protein KDA61_13810, partial [Planctomycetales bacterium]|nr:hypothetical protein [Planctomycetales bacterium]
LNIDQIKAQLREKLLESARISGDSASEAEIDVAIDRYYERLHEFHDPRWSLQIALAHVWIRRGPIVKAALLVAFLAALAWGLLVAGFLPGETRDRKRAENAYATAAQAASAIEQASNDEEVAAETRQLLAAAENFRDQRKLSDLHDVSQRLQSLLAQLNQEFTVAIQSASGERSGVEREYTDDQGTRHSGFYVIVEARDANDRPVQLPIFNRETERTEFVSRWGEQVPREVFDRLADDKLADGVLDERHFATKHRGERDWEIVLRGPDGAPLARQGQITHWEQ